MILFGPIISHNWGMLFWLISKFDLLSRNEWGYVEPLKKTDTKTENTRRLRIVSVLAAFHLLDKNCIKTGGGSYANFSGN
jgi:hypothetical protein